MRNTPTGAVLLLLAVALTACTPANDGPTGDTSELALQPASDEEGGDQAQLAGILHREGGCTYVELEDGALVIPVFQEGDAAWGEDGLLVGDADPVKAGDEVEFGGGYVGGSFDETMTVPDGCRVLEADLFTVAGAS